MNMRRYQIVFLGMLIFSFGAGAQYEAYKAPFEQTMNVVYAERDGVGLVMDVFVPKAGTAPAIFKPGESGKGAAIVDIASGGWSSDRGKIEDHKIFKMYDVFCCRGYTVFAVRPGSDSKFTGLEMLDNVNSAIRYIKEHAKQYGFDPERLGLTGASAGGHLACLAAVKAEDGDPKAKDVLRRHGTRVKAVGVFFPPTDFLNWGDGKEAPFDKARGLFYPCGDLASHSKEEINEMARALSPIYFVKENLPPFLIFHGTADPLVPLQQSESMVAALKEKGNSAELIIKKGGGHPWLTITEEIVVLADWFDKHLAAGGAPQG